MVNVSGVQIVDPVMEYSSFGAFYAAASDDCYRAVAVAVRDSDAAADLVSEAFVRALAHWGELERHPNPVGWVIVTAMNLHRDVRRRAARQLRLPEQNGSQREPALPVDRRLLDALMSLPRRQREVVALRVIADLDTRQTADLIGTSAATVRVHLHRALTRLRSMLIEENLV